MISLRQPVSDQQDQVDHPPDPTCFTNPSMPSSPRQRMPRKTMSGLSAACLGFLLSLGFAGGAALGSTQCDEQILGKEYCDTLRGLEGESTRRKREITAYYDENYGLNVCNRSSKSSIRTAIAYYHSQKYGWVSKGWWTINQGRCEKLVTESLGGKTYYLYGRSSDGTTWGGTTQLCINPMYGELFHIQNNCPNKDGFYRIVMPYNRHGGSFTLQ